MPTQPSNELKNYVKIHIEYPNTHKFRNTKEFVNLSTYTALPTSGGLLPFGYATADPQQIRTKRNKLTPP